MYTLGFYRQERDEIWDDRRTFRAKEILEIDPVRLERSETRWRSCKRGRKPSIVAAGVGMEGTWDVGELVCVSVVGVPQPVVQNYRVYPPPPSVSNRNAGFTDYCIDRS